MVKVGIIEDISEDISLEKSFCDTIKEVEEIDEDEKSSSHIRSCWTKWVKICLAINKYFVAKFTSLGYLVARYPKTVIGVGVFLSLCCMVGFIRFKIVDRVEDLYIPQNSQALKDLDRGHKHFALKLKAEEFIILKSDGSSILDDEAFKEALIIHEYIMSIPGLSNICIKHPVTGQCFVQSALEIFDYNTTKLVDVNRTLHQVYNTPSILLSNGRPAEYSYREFFADFQFDEQTRTIKKADGFRNLYFVIYPEDDTIYQAELKWEEIFIQYMRAKRTELSAKGYNLLLSSGKSLDGSIADSSAKDIQLVPVAFILMVLFCTATLAKFRNQVNGHFWLANGGVAALGLGIGAAFGFGMLIGAPYVAFAGVLPFLILGVGIDNIFIITDCLDRQQSSLTGDDRIAKAFGHVGASITMTTLTDLLAFAVSMVTDFPAIQYFCLYAALSIAFCYVLVITVFMAFLTYDARRIEEGKKDFLPCLKTKTTSRSQWHTEHDGIASKIMEKYGTLLMKTPSRIVVFLFSIALLVIGIYGATNIDQSFDMLDIGLKGSDYVLFYSYRNDHYPAGFEVSVVVDEPIRYEDEKIQVKYSNLDKIKENNQHLLNFSLNWMTALRDWSTHQNKSTTGASFYPTLNSFLLSNPIYQSDIILDLTNPLAPQIKASRMLLRTKDNHNSIVRKDTMLSLREDVKASGLPAYPTHMMFIYVEQFVVILGDTIRNLAVCCGAILLITLPYLMHPMTTFFVFFGFVSLIFELLGLMYIWNVSLNSISMVVIVMAIGFAVDYSAHVSHAYMVSEAATPEQRVIDSLTTMGSSVLMGGVSTFIGILVTAFASSEIFIIFFKMVFGIVVLGILHGLVFLPVNLSIFCRTDLRIPEDGESQKEGEQLQVFDDTNGQISGESSPRGEISVIT